MLALLPKLAYYRTDTSLLLFILVLHIFLIIAFDEVERKPNFDLWHSRVGFPVHGYRSKKPHPVRTPKWPPRLFFERACHGQ